MSMGAFPRNCWLGFGAIILACGLFAPAEWFPFTPVVAGFIRASIIFVGIGIVVRNMTAYVMFSSSGIEVRNSIRVLRIPWEEIESVDSHPVGTMVTASVWFGRLRLHLRSGPNHTISLAGSTGVAVSDLDAAVCAVEAWAPHVDVSGVKRSNFPNLSAGEARERRGG